MNILITGAAGFVGKNLTAALESLRDGKDRTHPQLTVETIYGCDVDTDKALLEEGCRKADFVFHAAGVNRPKDPAEFMQGNYGFSKELLDCLRACGNPCPIVVFSSLQASGCGRFAGSAYGESKRAGEELFFAYGQESGAPVYVYRFPNLFGKWCRPNYNSAVATFCHNLANDLPVQVNDPTTELELLYIDDLIAELLCALESRPHRCEFDGLQTVFKPDGRYCAAPVTHRATLGEIVELLESFRAQPQTLLMPSIPANSFAKKLYSTYLSYLPKEKMSVPLHMNADARGSFTELLRTADCGQFSVNISKPGITKGQHWHHSKWEFFIVVSGQGLILQRKLGTQEVLRFPVSGERLEAVHMLPGYTHSIINLSQTQELVTLMWANECFDAAHPDTFFEAVE